MYIWQEHEKCVRFYLITASKGHNLPSFALSNYLKVTFLCLIEEKLFCLRWRNQIKYLDAIWSPLHPFFQAAHCYQSFACRCWSIQHKKIEMPQLIHPLRVQVDAIHGAPGKNGWPYILMEDSLSFVKEQTQGLSLIHIWRCRRYAVCRSRWSPYH